MLKRWLILISIIVFLVLVSYFGLRYLFVPQARSVSLEYIVNIWPKEGENPKNVTVYLPFPHHEGKPVEKVFEAMNRYYSDYYLSDYPDSKVELVSTKYGKMLKVYLPELGEGVGLIADPLDPEYGPSFREPISLSPPSTRYVLQPRFEVRKKNHNQVSHSWIYLDYEDATGIILRSQYIVKSRAQMPIGGFFGSHPSGSNFWTYIGTDDPPRDPQEGRLYSRPAEIEINEKGWIKIPVFEAGDYPEEVK